MTDTHDAAPAWTPISAPAWVDMISTHRYAHRPASVFVAEHEHREARSARSLRPVTWWARKDLERVISDLGLVNLTASAISCLTGIPRRDKQALIAADTTITVADIIGAQIALSQLPGPYRSAIRAARNRLTCGQPITTYRDVETAHRELTALPDGAWDVLNVLSRDFFNSLNSPRTGTVRVFDQPLDDLLRTAAALA